MTLLFNIFLLVAGLISFLAIGGKLRLFSILVSLSGLLGILYWIKDKRYAGRNVKQLLSEECHFLDPDIELVIVALFVVESLIRNSFATSTLITILVLLIDATSQYMLKKKGLLSKM
jgi:hypothetical protein